MVDKRSQDSKPGEEPDQRKVNPTHPLLSESRKDHHELSLPTTGERKSAPELALDLSGMVELIDSVVGPFGGKSRIEMSEELAFTRVWEGNDKDLRQTWSVEVLVDFGEGDTPLSMTVMRAGVTGKKHLEEALPKDFFADASLELWVDGAGVRVPFARQSSEKSPENFERDLTIAARALTSAKKALDNYCENVKPRKIRNIERGAQGSNRIEYLAKRESSSGALEDLRNIFTRSSQKSLPPLAEIHFNESAVSVVSESLDTRQTPFKLKTEERNLYVAVFETALHQRLSQLKG